MVKYLRALRELVPLLASTWRIWTPVVVALAAAFGVGLSVTDEDGDGAPDKVIVQQGPIVSTTVDGSAAPGTQPVIVAAPRPVVEDATEGLHRHLNEGDAPALAFPQAAGSQRGCETRTVRNMSSRRGTTVRTIVLHYTVGPNRPGLTDMDGTTTLANNPAAGVSWHFLVDREGHCYFSVPLTMKAWTQANANPFSVGIEIVNSGREPNLIDGAGKAKLALVISDTARKLDVPLGVGWVEGCSPQKPGVVDHFHLGACGGGHLDLTPLRSGGVRERVGAYVAAAWRLREGQALVRCQKNHVLNWRERNGLVLSDEQRATREKRRAFVRDRELRCKDGRPVRA